MEKEIEPTDETAGTKALVKADFFDSVWEESWTYIKTVVDVVHEPVLILDMKLCVMAANEAFYQMFRVKPKNTEGELVYKLGNGQWDIPSLRKLLEDVLPKHTFFKGFEVAHKFPTIGDKVMILNARQIHSRFVSEDSTPELCPPIILLAMEDVTEVMQVADKIAKHTRDMETTLVERTRKLEIHIEKLEKEMQKYKKKVKK